MVSVPGEGVEERVGVVGLVGGDVAGVVEAAGHACGDPGLAGVHGGDPPLVRGGLAVDDDVQSVALGFLSRAAAVSVRGGRWSGRGRSGAWSRGV